MTLPLNTSRIQFIILVTFDDSSSVLFKYINSLSHSIDESESLSIYFTQSFNYNTFQIEPSLYPLSPHTWSWKLYYNKENKRPRMIFPWFWFTSSCEHKRRKEVGRAEKEWTRFNSWTRLAHWAISPYIYLHEWPTTRLIGVEIENLIFSELSSSPRWVVSAKNKEVRKLAGPWWRFWYCVVLTFILLLVQQLSCGNFELDAFWFWQDLRTMTARTVRTVTL